MTEGNPALLPTPAPSGPRGAINSQPSLTRRRHKLGARAVRSRTHRWLHTLIPAAESIPDTAATVQSPLISRDLNPRCLDGITEGQPAGLVAAEYVDRP